MCVVTFDWEENNAKEKFKNFENKKSLSWAVVEVTDYCNFNCKWCFANASSNTNPKHMPKEKAELLIESLANAGVKQVTISGGEPTVYPYLKDVIRKANGHDLVVHMNTNGFLLTKELAKELKSLGLSQVQINIDSLAPENHDHVRGKKGSFNRAVQALINARDVGLTSVSQTVLTKNNENEILDIFKFARRLGLQRCRVWDMTPSDGCAKENMELLPANYFSTLQMLADYAYETGAQNIETGDPLFNKHILTDLPVSGGFCVASHGLFATISSKGDVFFCAVNRKPLYNIFDFIEKGEMINRVHKLKISEYTKAIKLSSICNKCKLVTQCKGGCPPRRELTSLNTDYWCNERVTQHIHNLNDPMKKEHITQILVS